MIVLVLIIQCSEETVQNIYHNIIVIGFKVKYFIMVSVGRLITNRRGKMKL